MTRYIANLIRSIDVLWRGSFFSSHYIITAKLLLLFVSLCACTYNNSFIHTQTVTVTRKDKDACSGKSTYSLTQTHMNT